MNAELSKILRSVTEKSKCGEHNDALRLCEQALSNFPDSYEIFESRSEVYYRMGEYDKAFLDLDNVIMLMPNEAAPYFRKGRWELKLGLCDKAIDNLSKAINLDSGYFSESAFFFRAKAFLLNHEYKKALLDCEHVSDGFSLGPDKETKEEVVRKATQALSTP